jgi:hypothetical protein
MKSSFPAFVIGILLLLVLVGFIFTSESYVNTPAESLLATNKMIEDRKNEQEAKRFTVVTIEKTYTNAKFPYSTKNDREGMLYFVIDGVDYYVPINTVVSASLENPNAQPAAVADR